jgi:pyruvate dehydrogenase E2 component (dihydrolipoamide acetyltransferase)
MTNRIPVTVPDIGDFKDVEVIDVLVKEGDSVAAEAALVTLETEKATMDVPCPQAGVVARLAVRKGDRVSMGSLVLELDAPAEAAAPAVPASPAAPVPVPAPSMTVVAAAPVAAPAAAGSPVAVRVPNLGDFKDVAIIDVPVRVGDVVAADATLLTLESEKAAMDVPAPVAGRVVAVHVQAGGRVSEGTLIAEISPSAGSVLPAAAPAASSPVAVAPAPAVAAAPAAAVGPAPVAMPARSEPAPGIAAPVEAVGFARAHAGPSVRRLARELGVDLARLSGTGVKGRITHDDVKAYVKRLLTEPGAATAAAGGGDDLPKVPVVDFAKFGPVDVQKLGRIQKISGQRLHASWVNVPHVTQFEIADITALEEARGQLKQKALIEGIKLTPLAFVLRAVARVLAAFPRFCSSLDASGENLVIKKYMHIGFAADTPQGLVVPVIRDANRKDVYELARGLGTLSEKARDGKLSGADMSGGCFTISSLGGIGGTAFTPIINAPEVAILGLSRSSMQPVYIDGSFVPRLMLPLSLSYDHRVIDGAEAARFVVALADALKDARGLLEAVP